MRNLWFGIILSLKCLVSVSDSLCVCPFPTSVSNEEVKHTSARRVLGIA